MSGEETNRRAHFRLPYPHGAGPLLTIGKKQFAVIELSEGGLKFARAGIFAGTGNEVTGWRRVTERRCRHEDAIA